MNNKPKHKKHPKWDAFCYIDIAIGLRFLK